MFTVLSVSARFFFRAAKLQFWRKPRLRKDSCDCGESEGARTKFRVQPSGWPFGRMKVIKPKSRGIDDGRENPPSAARKIPNLPPFPPLSRVAVRPGAVDTKKCLCRKCFRCLRRLKVPNSSTPMLIPFIWCRNSAEFPVAKFRSCGVARGPEDLPE